MRRVVRPLRARLSRASARRRADPSFHRPHRDRLLRVLHQPRIRGTCRSAARSAGRLRFSLRPDLAPRTCANFLALVAGTNAGVDPALTYAGCAFEPFSGKYAHVCKGRGKHIYGAGKFVEREAMSATRRATPGAGGGVYYGIEVDLDDDPNAIVLAVPVAGPGFGATRFAVVRVGTAPGVFDSGSSRT